MEINRQLITATGTACSLLALQGCNSLESRPERPNVLFIGIDDLNDWLGCYGGHPQAISPNIDKLASHGMLFANAHCQSPLCNPSRASLLTGTQPASTGLHFLKPLFRNVPSMKDTVTLPQYFRQNGYYTISVGKIFHRKNDPESFNEDGGKMGEYGPLPKKKISNPTGHKLWDWGAFPKNEEDTPDCKIADWAVQKLEKKYDKPFFLAVGFYRPHVPLFAPQRWFDLYPKGKTILPLIKKDDLKDLSKYSQDLTFGKVAPRHQAIVDLGEWEHAVRSYLACVSFVDHQVGKVLEALKKSPYAKNTFVVIWSDHGFHLGEKLRWGKRSLWEESTRSPLIFYGPGIKAGKTKRPVGLIDIYPTLVEYCRLPEKKKLEGHSLMPLLANPKAEWPYASITSFGPGNHSIRTERWRYIRYADGSEELYDHDKDPHEWQNLAKDAQFADIIKQHRKFLPKKDVPLVPKSKGSDSLIFP